MEDTGKAASTYQKIKKVLEEDGYTRPGQQAAILCRFAGWSSGMARLTRSFYQAIVRDGYKQGKSFLENRSASEALEPPTPNDNLQGRSETAAPETTTKPANEAPKKN